MNKTKRTKWKKVLAAGAAGLFLVGCQTAENGETVSTASSTGNVNEEGQVQVSEVHVDVSSGISEAVEKVDEAVVSVINMQEVDLSGWGVFEGAQTEEDPEETYQQAGTGSGVVYKVDGDTAYVVTNNHVVEGSDAIEIMLKDGTQVEAKLIGSDVWTDLAVLTVSSEQITTVAEFGNSENLTVGEPAIAIGSPLGTDFASSVTAGIISATGRSVPVDTNNDDQVDWEMTAIQTDAAINPGNSGGALVNIAGQVVGINSMKISTSTVEGMGFAIPSNDVVNIVNQLEQNGEVIRPVLGISLIDLSMISSQQRETVLTLPDDVNGGVVVAQVVPGSAAETAGMQQYDVIVGFDGQEVTNSMELRQLIYSSEIGSEVEVEFYRDGELQTTTVTMTSSENNM
ncbi:S1C family serine protease [Atopococcus tabaci]|uniref:S1C family serine protease n=1 Tax=Atopococcus tabaci TaxID=269774 RepID=UPI0003F99E34|nr:trypsin-like peptidase domain-containing protein [Atopococcus tabaci]